MTVSIIEGRSARRLAAKIDYPSAELFIRLTLRPEGPSEHPIGRMMKYEALKFLDALASDDSEWFFSNSRVRTIMPGEYLVREGEQHDALYLVSDGLLDVHVSDALGRSQLVNKVGAGSILLEVSWLDGAGASATLRAAESSTVFELPTAVLNEKLGADNTFAARFYRAVALTTADRLRRAHQNMPAAVEASAMAGDGMQAVVVRDLAAFKALVAETDKRALDRRREVDESDRRHLREAFSNLCRAANAVVSQCSSTSAMESFGALMRREMLPYVAMTRIAERFYSKPRGYAGD